MEEIYRDGDYSIQKQEDYYIVQCGDETLETPGGKVAKTSYLPLAQRLLKDWKELGYDSYTQPDSILSYHFSLVENFLPMSKQEVLNMLNTLNWERNWTFQRCPSPDPHVWMQWIVTFGQGDDKKIQLVRQWMRNCTHMQLVAMTCVYNATMSYNVAFYLAVIVEEVPEEEQEESVKHLHDFYSKFDPSIEYDEFWRIFECFRLYYGIHFQEEGNHLPDPQKKVEESEPEEEKPQRNKVLDMLLAILTKARGFGLVGPNDKFPNIPEIMAGGREACMKVFKDLVDCGEEEGKRPNVWFAWAAYTGMGAVYHWHVDWNALKTKGIAETMLEPRGSFALDEYVIDTIGIGFESEDGQEFSKHIYYLSMWAFNEFLPEKADDESVKVAFDVMYAMYLFGMVLEMERLGMK